MNITASVCEPEAFVAARASMGLATGANMTQCCPAGHAGPQCQYVSSITVAGISCDDGYGDWLNGVYTFNGVTLDGRPWHRGTDAKKWDANASVCYDASCDGDADTPGRWVLDRGTLPNLHALNDLDEDKTCRYAARWVGNDRTPPVTTSQWRVLCDPGGWEGMQVTVRTTGVTGPTTVSKCKAKRSMSGHNLLVHGDACACPVNRLCNAPRCAQRVWAATHHPVSVWPVDCNEEECPCVPKCCPESTVDGGVNDPCHNPAAANSAPALLEPSVAAPWVGWGGT